jgi:hypothetical protein
MTEIFFKLVNLFKIVSSVYKHLKDILRPRLVCGMGISLGKRIGIYGNKRGWNGIIIPTL